VHSGHVASDGGAQPHAHIMLTMREPLGKVPVSAWQMEQRGLATDAGDRQRGVKERNVQHKALGQSLNDIGPETARPSRDVGTGSASAAYDVRDGRLPARHASIAAAILGLAGSRSIADAASMHDERADRAPVDPDHCAIACAPHRTTGHRRGVRRHGHEGVRSAHNALWHVENG
tara:strand:+ start:6757 stop:7281 length:525 start_codon:yes stop_codon:yes gene_type:complete